MKKILTFYLKKNLLGIAIDSVKEINRRVEYSPVPGANPNIAGLFNMRGQVVTLFNLARIMGFATENEQPATTCIILKTTPNDPNQVGLLIDRPGSVIDINPEQCEEPPASSGIEHDYIITVAKLKDDLLLEIDPVKILKY